MSRAVSGLMAALIGGISPVAIRAWESSGEKPIIVGSKLFTEQYILGELMSKTLISDQIPAEHISGMGSTILYEALRSSQVDAYVDYSGTIWTNIMKRTEIPSRQKVLNEMTQWLDSSENILCLGSLGFENAYALGMRREQAESLEVESIADLAAFTREMEIGGDYDFFSRPEWASVRDAYGLNFAELRNLDPSLMYTAVAEKEVDVISAFSTDGRIIDYDLKLLDDPKGVLPPYDAVILISPSSRDNQRLIITLSKLIGNINSDLMRKANNMVDLKDKTVLQAADSLHHLLFSK